MTRSPSANSVLNQQLLFKKALLCILAYVLIAIFLVFLALRSGEEQMIVVAGVMVIMTLVALFGAALIRRSQLKPGAWLLISVPLVVIATAGVLLVNIGLVLAFMVVLVTLFLATQLLPGNHATAGILLSFGVAVFLIIWDQFYFPFRLQSDWQVTTVALTTTGLLLLGYLIFVIREFKDYSLRSKLVIAFILVTILSVGIVVSVTNWLVSQALIATATKQINAASGQTADVVDTFLQNNLTTLRTEAQLPLFSELLEATDSGPDNYQAVNVLLRLSEKDPKNIVYYGLLDRSGRVVADTAGSLLVTDESANDYFKIPFTTNRPYISPVFFSGTLREPVFYISTPVQNVLGEPVGVLKVIYRADILQQVIEQENQLLGEGSFALLFDEHNLRLADGEEPDARYTLAGPLASEQIDRLRAEGRLPPGESEEFTLGLVELQAGLNNATSEPSFVAGVHREDVTEEHEDRLSVTPLQVQPNWRVAFAQPPEVVLAPVQEQTRLAIILAVVVVVGVGAIAFGLGQYLTGPIVRLTRVAEQITAGDMQVKAPVESQDEIGTLAGAINTMTNRLSDLIGNLEEKVEQRTRDLVLSLEVGQRASAIRDLDQLLTTVVDFLTTEFGLDVVFVYLMDDAGRNLVARASSDRISHMREPVPVTADVTVAHVAASCKPMIVNGEIDRNALPGVRSQLTVPLVVENQVIGVLDVHSTAANAFSEEVLTVFEAMATQLAISIDSARQWASSIAAQKRSEQILKLLTQQAWSEQLTSQKDKLSYVYDLSEIEPMKNSPEADITLPLLVQNQPIGELAVKVPDGKELSEDEQALLLAVSQQLAQKAENLRLFDQTQRRASREQLTREITDRMRAAPDVETILQTGLSELARVLGVSRTYVKLSSDLNQLADDQKAGVKDHGE
jgi:GAF domain-containing protein/HAMP domain-containing protein